MPKIALAPRPVLGKRPSLLSTIFINLIAALLAQVILVAITLPLFWRILHTTLTAGGYHDLLVKAIMVGCISAVIGMVASEQILERSLPKPSRLWEYEADRAAYYAAIGILAIAIDRSIAEGNVTFAWGLTALCLILLGFARYHARFKEARQGIWFPYLILHIGLQVLVLFPFYLRIVRWTLLP